ncbi:hypothetical protein [Streptomyces rhizosphaerihabitans]|uniref:hypothetical protein n=1 Tax=Streptomyces rhizosphaerihabitans TaxID=1266770 RepID=UPI0021C248C1|nr:hypothetical protein [Streptomyces rhizosphaerihabitans]MCT9007048.1 hypothetical protein [Streptomyces rhizosphaerihabitans]
MAGKTGESTCAGRSRTEFLASGEGPVFVDESGRRRSWLRSMGWIVAVSCVCFATALTALVSGSDSAAPWLPLPNGARKAHKDTSAADAASRVEERPTGTPSPSAVGREGAFTSPPGLPAGHVTPPTGDPAAGQRVGAASEQRPPSHGASAASSPSAVSPSGRPSATPPRVAPATPAGETSGSPSPSPSGTPGEATQPPAPDPSAGTTAGTTSAAGPLVHIRVTGLPAFG